jgi:DNA replication protein DnaC
VTLFDDVNKITEIESDFVCPVCGHNYEIQTLPSPFAGGKPWKRPVLKGHEECLLISAREAELEQSRTNDIERKKAVDSLITEAFSMSELNPLKRTLDSFKETVENQVALNELNNLMPGQKGFLVYGQPGSGKTHLVCATAQRMIREFAVSTLVVQVRPWLDRVLLSPFEESDALIQKAQSVSVLVLDDLGSGTITEAADERLQRVLDARIEFDRTTLATTNLSGAAFRDKLTPRTASRAICLMRPIQVTGIDHRISSVKK